jgi:chorismate mutase
MSSTDPLPRAAPETEGARLPPRSLEALRAELDAIDDALLATLQRRAAVVAEVAALKNGGVPLRPGREAAILRRLLGQAAGGPLPRQAVVRVWREILAGSLAQQGHFAVAVGEPGGSQKGAISLLAREHFGALTPLHLHRSASQAIGDVAAGVAAVVVLPLPAEEDAGSALWWTSLLHQDRMSPGRAEGRADLGGGRIHIIARLPFWAPRPEGAPRAAAFVAAAIAPDASGADRTLFGLEFPAETSRARLASQIAAAGLSAGTILLRREGEQKIAQALVDLAGFIAEDDPRLAAIEGLLRPAVRLGAYAEPFEDDQP